MKKALKRMNGWWKSITGRFRNRRNDRDDFFNHPYAIF
jgi:hypothetical protein